MDLGTLESRHSVRNFSTRPLGEDVVRKLRADITFINTHEAGMHFELVTDDPDPFRGFRRSYGMFRNVTDYIAVVADTSFANYMERTGYCAQQLVMEAVSMGLGTCYVGGTYDSSVVKVNLRVDRKILFIIAIGYPERQDNESLLARVARKLMHRKIRPAWDFFSSDIPREEAIKLFPMIETGLEAVACAPSALNRQPVRLWLEQSQQAGGTVTVCAGVDDSDPKTLIDLGIAKFNFQAVVPGLWEWGNGAAFIPDWVM